MDGSIIRQKEKQRKVRSTVELLLLYYPFYWHYIIHKKMDWSYIRCRKLDCRKTILLEHTNIKKVDNLRIYDRSDFVYMENMCCAPFLNAQCAPFIWKFHKPPTLSLYILNFFQFEYNITFFSKKNCVLCRYFQKLIKNIMLYNPLMISKLN